jgi:hypothetical protein
MGGSCSKEPQVQESIMDMKIKVKLKTAEVENKINDKNKEVEKYQQQAKFYLKSGNKLEAKRQIQKKLNSQKIVERLGVQLKVLDDQLLILENVEVDRDITETIKTVNEKIKLVTNNTDIRELERIMDEMKDNKEIIRQDQEEFNEVINQANEEEADLSAELEQMEAEMNKDIPNANTEKLDNDNKQANKEPAENLVFY